MEAVTIAVVEEEELEEVGNKERNGKGGEEEVIG